MIRHDYSFKCFENNNNTIFYEEHNNALIIGKYNKTGF